MAIEIISTLKPKNNGSFPIAEAKDITVDENGTRLDTKLEELANNSGGSGGGSYVLELTAESGTLTDEQYNAVVANAPNVVIAFGVLRIPLVSDFDGEEFVFSFTQISGGYVTNIGASVGADKSYNIIIDTDEYATKTYVDNAVANAGGGGGIIDVAELPTEGIDEHFIYRLANAGGAEVYAVVPDGGGYSVQEAATFLGVPTIIVVTEDPQNETLTEFTETSAFLYVQQSTGVVYLNYGGTITTLSAMIGATDGGWSTDVNNETPSNATIYAVSKTTYSYHACKNGAWVELVDKNYADNKAAEEAAKIKGLKTMVLPVIGSLYKNIALLAGSTEFFRVKYDGSINYEYTKDGANGSGSIVGNSFDVTYTEQSGMIMVSLSSYGISSSTELLLIGDGSTLNNTGLVHTVDGVKQEVTSVDTSEMTNITLYYF